MSLSIQGSSSMPTEPTSNNLRDSSSSRQPLWSERIFLSGGGRLRPIIRALLFAVAVFVVNVEVGSAVFNSTKGSPIWWQLFWSSVALVASFLALSWIFVSLFD